MGDEIVATGNAFIDLLSGLPGVKEVMSSPGDFMLTVACTMLALIIVFVVVLSSLDQK